MKTTIRKKTWQLVAFFLFLNTIALAANAGDAPQYFYQPALLQKQLSRFTEIDQNGGWQKLVLNKKQYKEGESAPFIKQLKARLQVTGELKTNDTTSRYTFELAEA